MKKILALFLCALLILSTHIFAFAANDVTVNVDGKTLSSDVPPQIINNRTMVPLRAIFETLGATVAWDDSTKTVTAIKDNTVVSCTIGSYIMTVNSKKVSLDVAPQIVNGRTLVPARFVAEALGCNVSWDGEKRIVSITSTKVGYYSNTNIPSFTAVTGIKSEGTTVSGDMLYNIYEIETTQNLLDYWNTLENDGWVFSGEQEDDGVVYSVYKKGAGLVVTMVGVSGKTIQNIIYVGYDDDVNTKKWGNANCLTCAEKGHDLCQGHTCTVCNGKGNQTCNGCHGSGLNHITSDPKDKCVVCYGMGTQICPNCDGGKKVFYK